ncbi:Tat pathway signal sequence domain protein [Salinisphaera aquimarina]|uniref:Tat pathway signal sequence domain protein n=1 Tax=Salinisphaera aquimarina TaxID=2094031 RepID=A0ABV7EQL2_9GAMM
MLIRMLVAAVLVITTGSAIAQAASESAGGGVEVELNKLEPVDGACRAYLVTQNLTDTRFDAFQLDVVMFDNDGIVARRLAVQIAPMAPQKTSLKVFDIKNLACGDIGQLLLNDVLECRDSDGARDDCLSLISVSQRGNTPFIK